MLLLQASRYAADELQLRTGDVSPVLEMFAALHVREAVAIAALYEAETAYCTEMITTSSATSSRRTILHHQDNTERTEIGFGYSPFRMAIA